MIVGGGLAFLLLPLILGVSPPLPTHLNDGVPLAWLSLSEDTAWANCLSEGLLWACLCSTERRGSGLLSVQATSLPGSEGGSPQPGCLNERGGPHNMLVTPPSVMWNHLASPLLFSLQMV